jgi:fatty-acyl-CoA synthase
MTALRSSNVADILRRTAGRVPGRIALRFEDREWTYRELDAAITRAAGFLLGLGLAKGDRVAAYGKNSDAYLIGFLACARAGLIHVPINYNLTGEELSYLVTQSGSAVALVDPALMANVDGINVVPLRDSEDSLLRAASEGAVPELDVEVADTDLVQLLYTSGTTSKPKGAMMTHRALIHEYLSCLQSLDLREDDEPLHVMPLYHSAQMHVFLMPWLAIGATNDLLEVPEPGEILRRLEKNGHSAFFAAPTLWVALANHADFATRDLGGLRKAYYGASIMPGPIRDRLAAAMPGLAFYNCFGQSEIGPLATVLGPDDHRDRPDSAGRPVLFVEAKVVDEQGNDVEPNVPGEIVYRSPQLCEGYWDKPKDTEEAFRDGWFHSGDLVRVDEEGYFFVVDRIKDVINTGGVLVASREVEDALYTHSAVAEVAVIGLPDEKWIEAVTAVVVSKEDVDAAELVAHVRGRLASFKLPKAIHFVDELPRNASGKILKRELRDRFA